jgi:hypothetical protein
MFFWLNATGLFRPALSPSVQFVATKLGIEFTSVSIVIAMLAFSLLSLYGLRNAVVSIIYIYTFPFILAWYLSRYFVRFVRWMQRVIRKALPNPNEGVPLSELMPLWRSVVVVKTTAAQTQAPASVSSRSTGAIDVRNRNKVLFERVLRVSGIVLGRSTLLCGFLMVASSVKPLIIASLIATTLGLIRTNILFLRNALDVKRLTVFINDNLVKWIEAITQTTQAQIKSGTNKDNPLGAIRIWKFMLNVIARAHEVPELLAVGGLLVFVVSYSWVASVFYFIYVGVTKLTLPGAEWPNVLNSILFPVMGSNIARTPLLTVFVALQWIELALLAYVLWRFLATEVDRFRKGIVKYEIVIDDRIKLLEADLAGMKVSSDGGKPKASGTVRFQSSKTNRIAGKKNTSSKLLQRENGG